MPFAEHLAGEGELRDRVEVEVGDEEGFRLRGADERESVGAGELRPRPLVRQFARFVVEDDVVGDVIGQKDDVSVVRAGEAMAVVDRGLRVEHAPARDDPIPEVALAEHFG